MAGDGSITIDVTLDESEFQRSMNGLPAQADASLGKTLAVYDAFKNGVMKVWGMITGQVEAAMNRLDTMDQFNRVMTTMLGSTEKANAALDKTSEIVAGTAYGLDTAAKGVQAFVASGMEVEKATDVMGSWADAVSFYTKGTNDELGSVSAALQKMQTNGKVSMENMQTLLEAGIPAVEIYASAVGSSAAEVSAAMSNGQISASEFFDVMNSAFNNGTERFPKIAGAAKEAGSSWKGSIDNMKAAVTRGVGACLTSFDKMFNVKGNMVAFGKTLEKVMKWIAENMDKVIVATAGVVAGFVTFKIVKTVSTYMSVLKKATDASSIALMKYAAGEITAAKATTDLTLRQTLAGVATMVLSGQMSVGAAVTLVFKKAVDALNKTFLQNPIILIISLIAALIAVIIQAANKTNEEAESVRQEAESLKNTQDQLTESAAQSKIEYQQNVLAISESARAAREMAVELEALQSKTTRSAEEQERMNEIVRTLSKDYPELSAMIDENTGVLEGNAEEWKAIIEAERAYQIAIVTLERSTELAEEAAEASAALGTAEQMVAENREQLAANTEELNSVNERADAVYAQLNDGTERTAEETSALQEEYNSLLTDAENLRQTNQGLTDANSTLEDGMDDLRDTAERLNKEQDAQAKMAQRNARVIADAYNKKLDSMSEWNAISGQVSDEEIARMQALMDAGAEFSAEEVRRYGRIKVGREDYIQAIRDGNVEILESEAEALEARRINGEELNSIEQAKLDRWKEINEEALKAYQDQQQSIVDAATNTQKEINLAEQQGADERLKIQEHNLEIMRNFKDNYNAIYGKIPEEQRGYLTQMTEEDAAFLQEITETWDEGGKEKWETWIANQEEGAAIAADLENAHGVAIANAGVDAYTQTANERMADVAQSGADTGQAYGEGIANSTAPQEGAQTVVDNVITSLSNADYSGITNGMAETIQNGASNVTTAMESVADNCGKVMTKMTKDAGTESKKMTAQYASGIRVGGTAIYTALVAVLNTAKTGAQNIANTFTEIGRKIVSRITEGVNADAGNVQNSVQNAVNGGKNVSTNGYSDIGYQMVNGMAQGVRANESILTNAIRQVVKKGVEAAKQAAEIRSPSKVFSAEVGYWIPAGIAAGIGKGERLATASAEDMTKDIIRAGKSALSPAFAAMNTNIGAKNSVVNFEQNNTIVQPKEMPSAAYRRTHNQARRLIHELG